MMTRIRRFLSAPIFEDDEDKTHVAGLVNGMLLIVLAGLVLFLLAGAIGWMGKFRLIVNVTASLVALVVVGLKLFLRRGNVQLTGVLLALAIWASFTVPIYTFDSIRDVTTSGYFVVIAMVSLMLGERALLAFGALSSLAILGAFYVERGGIIAAPWRPLTPVVDLVTVLIMLMTAALLSGVGVRRMTRGYERARRNEQALSAANQRLQAATAELTVANEQLVSEIAERRRSERLLERRNRELTTLFEATRAISSDLSLDVVLQTVAEQMTTALRLQGCTLSLWNREQNLIETLADYWTWSGKTAATGVTYNLGHYPATRRVLEENEPMVIYAGDPAADEAELALLNEQGVHTLLMLPWIARDQVMGLVELSDSLEMRDYTPEEIRLAQNLAAQAAVAVENARLYEQAHLEITERKRAEEALKDERASLARRVAERTAELSAANAELTRAVRAKDEFLAAMSHELRTPLNVILGMSEGLQDEIYGPLGAPQRRPLRAIDQNGRHLLSLITDILDVANIGAGRLRLAIGQVPVEPVCEASLQSIAAEAQKKRLTITTSFDSTVVVVRADGQRLRQILDNLLSNAAKFTPDGGAIGLEVQGDAERESVHFIVWDTGVGIPEEDVKRLFQPFAQLDGSLARQYEGTGLGLALVHRLTEMHGGGILVESEVGKGSRFTISLPWRPAAGEPYPAGCERAETNGERPTIAVAGSQVTILVAEDSESNIDVISEYLPALGYRVVAARDGTEAIARAREERPDVILMDIQMPVMDGLEATRRIRADADLGDIPIIALTALAMPGDRERCLEAGASEYLDKPVSLKDLVKVIEAQLG
jgi:signal transduction histidine kinase